MAIPFLASVGLILACCILGLLWALYNYLVVYNVKLEVESSQKQPIITENNSDQENLNAQVDNNHQKNVIILSIGKKISDGAKAFLHAEYKYCTIVLLAMSLFLYLSIDSSQANWRPYTSVSFLIGGFTSIACGYIAMMIAVQSNYRTSFMAQKGLHQAYKTALAAGVSMGFALVSIALLTLTLLIMFYKAILTPGQDFGENIALLFEYVAGYGLGGSTVALFGRVGGGIYTKAADVGADLVGKVEQNLAEDSPHNPATIADNVGDNVGDVAGMGADLFGSFAESTCAALVISAKSLQQLPEGDAKVASFYDNIHIDNLMFPLMITAAGILCCIVVSFYGVFINKVREESEIESSLKKQLLFSTILLTPVIVLVAYMNTPLVYYMQASPITEVATASTKYSHNAFICVIVGLWSGLAIGYITEYMTSHSYSPVREVAQACVTGAATNIIYGLALGYFSTIIPIIAIAFSAFVSTKLLGFYGVALAALGMLSNLPIGLAIDGYGPISDNAGGIAEMAELGEDIRKRTDALDAAGNTTAAIGKGFAIGSAALVSLSLYGGFITNARANVDAWHYLKGEPAVTDSLVFANLLIGAMLPYAFSAFTMKSVGKAALQMVEEIRRQIKEKPGILNGQDEPDYQACIKISTQASLKEMVAPALLVILSPIIIGFLFGPLAIAGLLPGALVSGVQMAISSSNTGGAWDNAKKYIEGKNLVRENGEVCEKGSEEHKAAVIGDTVGDPLKDTSGPALNILIKLMAIISLVFAGFFCRTGILYVE